MDSFSKKINILTFCDTRIKCVGHDDDFDMVMVSLCFERVNNSVKVTHSVTS